MNSRTAASADLIAGIGDGESTRENRAPQADHAPAKTLAQKLMTITIVLLFVSATVSWIGFLGWSAWRLLDVNP
ncbi:hypothetical protein [Bosea psychrotolerans]|uniref:hypothetical protein n=1 Tax=Bosea psychrotolerans TaxID=1871628 RepID=UPI0011B06639|nr:hypothetical protein [Bosea psychrotolerans]